MSQPTEIETLAIVYDNATRCLNGYGEAMVEDIKARLLDADDPAVLAVSLICGAIASYTTALTNCTGSPAAAVHEVFLAAARLQLDGEEQLSQLGN